MNLRDINEQRRINNGRKLHTESWLKILIIPIFCLWLFEIYEMTFLLIF